MNTTATWSISLDCECPHCKKFVDLTDMDDIFEYIEPAESRKNFEAICPKCREEFNVECEY